MATVTTIYRPDPTCYAASNLWLNTRGWGCNTYYPPFVPRPTEILPPLSCAHAELGRPADGAFTDLCHQKNWVTTGATIYSLTAYSDCPEGMTAAQTDTREREGITIVNTICCPSAYDFTPAGTTPTLLPSVIDDTTYLVTYSTSYADCKAASVTQLSGQTVTMTVSIGSQSSTTTEVEWDYEHDFITATGAIIYKYLYPNPRAGTTSTCFGEHEGCVSSANPYLPTPTYPPRGKYIPPPSPAVTRFTPAPSCLPASSNLWLVSDKCSLHTPTTLHSPPWLQCTYTVAGEPDTARADCYQTSQATVVSGTPSYYTACPVGYTTANVSVRKPYDDSTRTFDVEWSSIACCPSAFGDVPFTYSSNTVSLLRTTTYDGEMHYLLWDVVPRCFAAGIDRLDGQEVHMGLYSDQGEWVWELEEEPPGRRYNGTTTAAVWDRARDTLFAHAATVTYAVFHGTHTCFERCGEYFTYSYYNTPPPGWHDSSGRTTTTAPTTATDEEGAAATPTPSSAAAAALAVVKGGDVPAGLSSVAVVVVIVTVIQVAIGGFV